MIKEILLVSWIFLVSALALPASEAEKILKETQDQPLKAISSIPADGEDDLNTAEYRHRGWGGGGWGRGFGGGGWGRGYGGGWGGYGGGWGGGYGRGYGGGYGYGGGWGGRRGYYW